MAEGARRLPARSAAGLMTLAVAVAALVGCAGAPAEEPPSAAPPQGKLAMTGDIGDYQDGGVDDPVHDPTLFKQGKTFYVFSTGRRNPADPGGIFAHRSTGSLAGPWESLGS
ncbi:MAG TPA: hypothetical protein VGJ44_10445, partial [Kribbellaceae bacterium]